MFTITKEFHFSAGHFLNDMPKNHPCARQHGHNYIIKMELASSKLNKQGFVMDYHDLSPVKKYIDELVDHYNLNAVFDFQPSAENMARHFFEKFKEQIPLLSAVGVSETPKTWAWYRPDFKGEAMTAAIKLDFKELERRILKEFRRTDNE